MSELESLDLYARSDNDIAIALGRRFKDYRVALKMTQKEIAQQSGVSVMTIVRFENGDGCSIRLDNFIALMRAIQRLKGIANAVPEVPHSLYDVKTTSNNVSKRVRKR